MFSPQQIGRNILNKIVSHLGQREEPDGSNSGPNVAPKLAYVGLTPGNPWCAAEASYDTGDTLLEMGIDASAVLRTGSSHEAVNWAIQYGTVLKPQSAVPGDWCILKGGDGERAQDGHAYEHTTILERVDGVQVHWIGGNTGNAVARGQSALSDCCLLRPYVL